MSSNKTTETDASVEDFLGAIKNKTRQEDGRVVVRLMQQSSNMPPRMWGSSIIGFGKHHYQLASGKAAEICHIGFSPRAQALVFYLGNVSELPGLGDRLGDRLGKHRVGNGGCIYINKLKDVDLEVLKEIIAAAWEHRTVSSETAAE